MKRILRTREAAKYLGVSKSFLEKKRQNDGGPSFIWLSGRAIGYDVGDLDRWLERQPREVRDSEDDRALYAEEAVAPSAAIREEVDVD